MIEKYALQNAIKFNGKCDSKAIIGKVLQENPNLKNNMKELMQKINNTVKEINKLALNQQIKRLKEIAPELLEERKEERKDLKELPNVKNKVVMRIAPSPSGPLHIGHVCNYIFNSEYCKRYKGDFIVRIDDTNADNIYKPAYKMIEDDSKWLCNNINKVVCQSDFMGSYYDAIEKLIELNKAYVCECSGDEFREYIKKRKACPCRNKKDHTNRFAKMFSEYKPGEAIVRIKTNLRDKNPAMIDFGLARIKETIHPKTSKNYRVWPLLNLAVAVCDKELKITHAVRGKDQQDGVKKERIICDYLNWNKPEIIYFGMINFEGMELSKTKIKLAIERNEFDSWEDIRLPFLAALRKRGYKAEALRRFALDLGLTENDKTVDKDEFFKLLNYHQKQIIEKSFRYFMVVDPIEIKLDIKKEIELDLHPESKKGGRKLKINKRLFISKIDFDSLKKDYVYRFMDLCNFTLDKKIKFHSETYDEYKSLKNKGGILHYLPYDDYKVKVRFENNLLKDAIIENKLKNGEIFQAERMGFFVYYDKEILFCCR
ncbi:glutamate--tRNA ligase [Candidatus Woesearchaeota archaeon]|nr:glutamate--tRNA ligase [Candidatus Woesearchaeota archaeon]